MARASSGAEKERSERELRLGDALAANVSLELDLKVHARALAKAKDERDSLRSQHDRIQSDMEDLKAEAEALRDQLKQKDTLLTSSHNTLSAKWVLPEAGAMGWSLC
jgi:phage shock protein A